MDGLGASARAQAAVAAAARDGCADTPAQLAARLLAVVVRAVDADGGALVLMDPHTRLFSTGAVDRLPAACCHPFFASEFDEAATRSFRRLASEDAPASALSAYGDPHDSFGPAVLHPFGYADELRAVCRDAGVAWAGVSLWRSATAPAFSRAHERLLDAVAPPMGAAVRDAVLRSVVATQASPAVGGVLIVEGRSVVEASPGARSLLREIDEPATVDYRPLDHLLAMAQRERRFSLVVGASDGRWITAHGSALNERRTAVVLTAPSPAELFGALVAGSGLTPREVEVTLLLCRGLTDAEIGRALAISAHTAHDHVRAVRRKLGVRSRSEVASVIFADRYLDRFLSTASVAHAG